MVLEFKRVLEKGIIDRETIHAIRPELSGIFKRGEPIQFISGMGTEHETCFKTGRLKSFQKIWIDPNLRIIKVHVKAHLIGVIKFEFHDFFAKKNGFGSIKELWDHFNEPFEGEIIHWSLMRYGVMECDIITSKKTKTW